MSSSLFDRVKRAVPMLGACSASAMLAACSANAPAQPFASASSALQTYDYSRLTPFPRKEPKAVLGTVYEPGEDELREVLAVVAPQLAKPESARLVRVSARSRSAGAVELCGLAQSQNQSGGDARMMLFGGVLTRAPDGAAHFSLVPTENMFDRVEFCRSRGLV